MPFNTPYSPEFLVEGAFPFCVLESIDVDAVDDDEDEVYIDWCTLGWWGKFSGPEPPMGKDKSISISLRNAMKFYWLFNGLTGKDVEEGGGIYKINIAEGLWDRFTQGDRPLHAEIFDNVADRQEFLDTLSVEPHHRTCLTNSITSISIYGADEFEGVAPPELSVRIGTASDYIVKMYKGYEFIGYGLKEGAITNYGYGIFPILAMGSYSTYIDPAEKDLFNNGSYIDFGQARRVKQVSLPNNYYDNDLYLDRIPFVADFVVSADVSSISIANTSAGISALVTFVGGFIIDLRIEDLTFYKLGLDPS